MILRGSSILGLSLRSSFSTHPRNGSFYYKPPDTSFSSGVLNPLDSAQDCLIKSIWVSFLNSSETNDFPNLIQRGQMANCCCLKYLNVVTVTRGGHLGIFWVGMCRPELRIGTPFLACVAGGIVWVRD